MKSMTLRLAHDQAADLDTVAAVDGVPVAEVVRSAIASHIEDRKRDPRFQAALKARIERDQRLLEVRQ
jgi:predicted DNA-binding protein